MLNAPAGSDDTRELKTETERSVANNQLQNQLYQEPRPRVEARSHHQGSHGCVLDNMSRAPRYAHVRFDRFRQTTVVVKIKIPIAILMRAREGWIENSGLL